MTLDWLPDELLAMVYRLSRADQCVFEITDLAGKWSLGAPLSIRHVWVDEESGTYEARVGGVRPIPPLMGLLFSEGIHHIRASLDNAVWHLVEEEHGPLTITQALLVAMPIYADAESYDRWVARRVRAGLTCLADTAGLGRRIKSLQPFVDTAQVVESMDPMLATLMGSEPEAVHPLLLLQAFSNADKHRRPQFGAARGFVSTSDQQFLDRDRQQRPVEIGEVLASGTWGTPTTIESTMVAVIQRPEPGSAWVSPSKELQTLRRYVADTAIPVLVDGQAHAGVLPTQIDMTDTGDADRARIAAGGYADAATRFAPLLAEMLAESQQRPPDFVGPGQP